MSDGAARAARIPRRPWQGRRVVLGVAGGIAAYKSAQLARDLTEFGATVEVVLTRSAREFIGPLTFEALTGRRVADNILEPGWALGHIRLARDAEVVCVAPATADLIARVAHGQAGDMLSALLLATRAPVLICPAMNDRMYAHPATRENLERLRSFGHEIVGPAVGPLAFGEGEGPGRLEEPAVIVQHIGRALTGDSPYRGRKIVVTAGPTREPLDPVRFLSNRSSGRMGFALAAAAWRRGADVLLITGPTLLEPPPGPRVQEVGTVEEMQEAVSEAIQDADGLIMSAAPADFRPARAAASKIKKAGGPAALELTATPDILDTTRTARRAGMAVVGFALETDAGRENARTKLEAKGLDMIVLNEATRPGAGFEVPTNEVVILDRDGGEENLPLLLKDEVAEVILDRVERWLPVRE